MTLEPRRRPIYLENNVRAHLLNLIGLAGNTRAEIEEKYREVLDRPDRGTAEEGPVTRAWRRVLQMGVDIWTANDYGRLNLMNTRELQAAQNDLTRAQNILRKHEEMSSDENTVQ